MNLRVGVRRDAEAVAARHLWRVTSQDETPEAPAACLRWRQERSRRARLAIGQMVIGRLAIGKARFKSLEVDELTVRKLRVIERLDGES